MLGYMAENLMSGECDVVEPEELAGLVESGWTLIDVRTRRRACCGGDIPGSVSVPLDCAAGVRWARSVPGPSSSIARSASVATRRRCCCTSWGIATRNLDGGYRTWRAAGAAAAGDAGPLGPPCGPRSDGSPARGSGLRPAGRRSGGSGCPTSLAENFTAFTALVAPVCSVAPMTMRMMPNQKR